MSKSKYNVVNPDNIIEEYGADTLRLYEMFLGPVEQSKPWNTSGIEGVSRFLNKLWKHLYGVEGKLTLQEIEASAEENKIIHTLIKKVTEDLESFSLNTAVSAFMIALNDLIKLKSQNYEVFKNFVLVLSPFAPHISEQIWNDLGIEGGISYQEFPTFDDQYLVESTYSYPISLNGKMKFLLELDLDLNKDQIQEAVMNSQKVQTLLEGKTIKKTIIVPKKIVNFVV